MGVGAMVFWTIGILLVMAIFIYLKERA